MSGMNPTGTPRTDLKAGAPAPSLLADGEMPDAAESTLAPPTDDPELRKAVGILEKLEDWILGPENRGALDLLLDRVRSLLPPEPVKKWGVNAGAGWVHFETADEAMKAAIREAEAGGRVKIERRVPV